MTSRMMISDDVLSTVYVGNIEWRFRALWGAKNTKRATFINVRQHLYIFIYIYNNVRQHLVNVAYIYKCEAEFINVGYIYKSEATFVK